MDTAPPDTSHDPPPLDLDERIALLAGTDMWHTAAAGDIPAIRVSDGPAGVRGTDWNGPASASFPCGTALAATFDPDLVREIGSALGREARSKSAHVLLAPTVNLHRTPVGGRNFECMSEDPVHTATIAVAYVEGVQSQRVACCIKHLVGNDTEFARFVVSSEIPERVLRELYLVPFEAAVAAGVRSIMTGYNRLNGTYCGEHPWLLTDLVRGEWGFDGLIVSDWYGTHSGVESLLAGLDVEMPGPPRYRDASLRTAYEAGTIADEHLDAVATRLRDLAEWTGAATTGTAEGTADDPVTRAVIRRAAAAGMVLLRNEGGALPLPSRSRLALIGPYASTGRVQGGGSAKVRPDQPSALRPALEARGFAVEHAIGCRIDKFLPTMRGEFDVVLTDGTGHSVTAAQQRLEMLRQHADHAEDGLAFDFGVTATGTFVPDTTGEWLIGVRAVGVIRVLVDGVQVVEIPEPRRDGSFFGFGSEEVTGVVTLTAGVPCRIEVDYPRSPGDTMRGFVVGARLAAEPDLVAEAVEVARRADVAVVVVGTNDEWETEGEDRASITLPGRQDELVAAVVAANPNTVVLVNTGSPVAMPWVDDVAAILQLWFPGGQLGHAVADVLSGDVEPGGRLPVTFPKRLEDSPAFPYHPGDGVRAEYGEGLRIGHRWYDSEGIEPLFPFGHGLGYTSFELDPVGVDGSPSDGVSVRVGVTNVGERFGAEVVQVYLRYAGEHPDVDGFRRFAGSAKVSLVPGERTEVEVRLDPRRFASWLDGGWTVPAGPHEVWVGRSSRAVELAGVVTG